MTIPHVVALDYRQAEILYGSLHLGERWQFVSGQPYLSGLDPATLVVIVGTPEDRKDWPKLKSQLEYYCGPVRFEAAAA
jgi:hypothetical protein